MTLPPPTVVHRSLSSALSSSRQGPRQSVRRDETRRDETIQPFFESIRGIGQRQRVSLRRAVAAAW